MDNEVRGISFPFRIGGRGGVAVSGQTVSEQQHIKESIMVLVGQIEGERVMNPSIGVEPLDIFFNNFDEATKNIIIFKLREKIALYEPRVEVNDIQIYPQDTTDGGRAYVISIMYTVVDTGQYDSVAISY